jgi:hypothetical protein
MRGAITGDEMALAISEAACEELEKSLAKIVHCVNQLTTGQVWWRMDESQNSIGNLILHLDGNVRQWLVSGLGGTKDVRNRPLEFSERRPIAKEALLTGLDATVKEATSVLSTMNAVEWLRARRIQGFDVTGVKALFDTVPHFRGHTQEIVYRTRCLLGADYKFSWIPRTADQGAPGMPA